MALHVGTKLSHCRTSTDVEVGRQALKKKTSKLVLINIYICANYWPSSSKFMILEYIISNYGICLYQLNLTDSWPPQLEIRQATLLLVSPVLPEKKAKNLERRWDLASWVFCFHSSHLGWDSALSLQFLYEFCLRPLRHGAADVPRTCDETGILLGQTLGSPCLGEDQKRTSWPTHPTPKKPLVDCIMLYHVVTCCNPFLFQVLELLFLFCCCWENGCFQE